MVRWARFKEIDPDRDDRLPRVRNPGDGHILCGAVRCGTQLGLYEPNFDPEEGTDAFYYVLAGFAPESEAASSPYRLKARAQADYDERQRATSRGRATRPLSDPTPTSRRKDSLAGTAAGRAGTDGPYWSPRRSARIQSSLTPVQAGDSVACPRCRAVSTLPNFAGARVETDRTR